MENKSLTIQQKALMKSGNELPKGIHSENGNGNSTNGNGHSLPEILFITSYPPRECGIATYSQDLIKALNNKFHLSFSLKVCALENENKKHQYPDEVRYILDTSLPTAYTELANTINDNEHLKMVIIQHEFGFFNKHEENFIQFLEAITKPIVMVFHTVLPHPDEVFKIKVQQISSVSDSIIVMTNSSAEVLTTDYGVSSEKITVIPHGTHLVPHLDKIFLKEKYGLIDRKVLSTFGLLSSGKSIETTLDALPAIVKTNPTVMFLAIGKTHPSVVQHEGEKYRNMLEAKVEELKLQNNVRFINHYLPLQELLEYLQLTDIYLFTSKNPNQAVSGTFSYAISCGCPIISTPIPHAKEVLRDDAGIIIDFENPEQLGEAVNRLLSDEQLRKNISSNGLHRIASTSWENAAIAHAILFEKIVPSKICLKYNLPPINLNHFKKLTTNFGIIQFSKLNQPDINSGYTLDDNARAMIAMCRHFEFSRNEADVKYIKIYLEFINYCLQPEGYFLNYVNEQKNFTDQNNSTNLADANGRAIWALGYLISISDLLPEEFSSNAKSILLNALLNVNTMHSTRAVAFTIKGLCYYNSKNNSSANLLIIKTLADRLVQMYKHESHKDWEWFESYLTYANSTLPEAMLCAYSETGGIIYKEIAKASFDFLLMHTFNDDRIKVISNKSWKHKGEESAHFGEQPIDVAYTILALSRFYEVFKDENYLEKLRCSFNWFLGENHLHQIIYNPCTGGCFDGLEENHVNLNQGAESTVSYLMARLTVEEIFGNQQNIQHSSEKKLKLSEQNQLV